MSVSKRMAVMTLVGCGIFAASVKLGAQPDRKPAEATAQLSLAKPGSKFQFDIIEVFDAKYLGDSPGYMGRSGGLTGIRPHVALGDPVYRGEEKIGAVTNVNWSRTQDGMTVEFDPAPMTRITVGESVWLYLNPPDGPAK